MVRTSARRLVWFCLLAVLASRPVTGSEPRLAQAEVAFAQGLAALHAGRLAEALERFTAAAGLHPRDREIAAYVELARRRLAGEEAAEPVPGELAQPIDDRGLWEGSAGLALAGDTNPNLFSEDLSLPPPGGGELIQGEEADAFARAGARLAAFPFHARPGPNLGLALTARRSLHRDFGFLDLTEARGALQLAFGQDPLGYLEGPLGSTRVPFGTGRLAALLQVGGSLYLLDDETYLRAREGAFSLLLRESRSTATRLDLSWADRTFADRGIEEARSGEDLALQVSQLFYLGRRERFVRLGVRALDRQAGREFAASVLEGNAEVAWPLSLRWTLSAYGAWREDEFDHPESNLFSPTAGEPRDDAIVRTAVALVWQASERLRWVARGTWVERDSDVDLGPALPDLDYRRLVVSAGLDWAFR